MEGEYGHKLKYMEEEIVKDSEFEIDDFYDVGFIDCPGIIEHCEKCGQELPKDEFLHDCEEGEESEDIVHCYF